MISATRTIPWRYKGSEESIEKKTMSSKLLIFTLTFKTCILRKNNFILNLSTFWVITNHSTNIILLLFCRINQKIPSRTISSVLSNLETFSSSQKNPSGLTRSFVVSFAILMWLWSFSIQSVFGTLGVAQSEHEHKKVHFALIFFGQSSQCTSFFEK